jgi:hypothetical protein
MTPHRERLLIAGAIGLLSFPFWFLLIRLIQQL